LFLHARRSPQRLSEELDEFFFFDEAVFVGIDLGSELRREKGRSGNQVEG
jgi:hypothetical protein